MATAPGVVAILVGERGLERVRDEGDDAESRRSLRGGSEEEREETEGEEEGGGEGGERTTEEEGEEEEERETARVARVAPVTVGRATASAFPLTLLSLAIGLAIALFLSSLPSSPSSPSSSSSPSSHSESLVEGQSSSLS